MLEAAFIQFTSGTTGAPRGALISHRAAVASAWAMGLALGLDERDVGVSWLPLFHDMGLVGVLLCSLIFRFQIHLLSPAEFLLRPSRWLALLAEARATLTVAPNFGYELAVRRAGPAKDLDLSRLRHALDGSEPVLRATLDGFERRFALPPGTVRPVYGWGGAGFSLRSVCDAVASLARIDRSVATTVGLHLGLGTRGLVAFGSDDLRATYLPELAAGRKLAAFAATESVAGSDLAAIATRAVEVAGGRLKVDGGKIYVTNGGLAAGEWSTSRRCSLGAAPRWTRAASAPRRSRWKLRPNTQPRGASSGGRSPRSRWCASSSRRWRRWPSRWRRWFTRPARQSTSPLRWPRSRSRLGRLGVWSAARARARPARSTRARGQARLPHRGHQLVPRPRQPPAGNAARTPRRAPGRRAHQLRGHLDALVLLAQKAQLARARAAGISMFYLVGGFDPITMRAFTGDDPLALSRARDAIARCFDAGIEPYTSFLLGLDGDDEGTVDRILEFTSRAKIRKAEFAIFTPYPGTPSWRRLLEEGRILHRDWSRYNDANVVFLPLLLTPDQLRAGCLRLWREFYAARPQPDGLSTAQRTIQF